MKHQRWVEILEATNRLMGIKTMSSHPLCIQGCTRIKARAQKMREAVDRLVEECLAKSNAQEVN